MAPRKPNKSQRSKPNKNLGDVLGGAAKVVGRAAAQNPLVAQNVRYGKAVLAGPTALAKTAATDLAFGAAGAGVGRVAQAAVRVGRVVNPVAAVRNITSGQRVVVHGSPQSGLSVLKPSTGSKTLPDKNVLFSWNPRRANMSNEIHMKAVRYANKADDAGSIYVAKVPKKATGPHPKTSVRDSKNMLVTEGRGKVVAEIPLSKPYSEIGQAERRDIYQKVQAELRKAGVQPRGVPQVVNKTLDKVDDALLRAQYKTKNVKQKFMTQAQKDAAAAARRKRIR